MIAIDSCISISPECAAHHQVLKQGKAGKVGIGVGEDGGTGVAFRLLPARGGLVVEMNRKGADGLREDPDACPDSGDGKGTFRGDKGFLCGVGHGV